MQEGRDDGYSNNLYIPDVQGCYAYYCSMPSFLPSCLHTAPCSYTAISTYVQSHTQPIKSGSSGFTYQRKIIANFFAYAPNAFNLDTIIILTKCYIRESVDSM